MSAFEPPQHQRSYSYPNPSLPPFSNLSQQTPHTINLHTPPLKKSSIMPSLDGGAASLQSAGTTTLPLLQPMDFSRYTTLYNTPTATQLAHQISHDRFQSNGNRADETPPTHHATLPSTPTEPTCASAHPTSLVESYLFAPQPKQHFAQILTWPQHHLEESREFITPSKINQGFTPLTLGNDLPLEAFPRSHTYSQPQTQGVPDYMGNMMRFEPIDEEEAAREAHLLKTRKHVCVVCNKRFNRPSSLSTHMAVHTGAKPFQCSRADCGRRFSVSSNLRRHEKTHIPGQKRGQTSPLAETSSEPMSRHQTSSSWSSSHSLETGSNDGLYHFDPNEQHTAYMGYGGPDSTTGYDASYSQPSMIHDQGEGIGYRVNSSRGDLLDQYQPRFGHGHDRAVSHVSMME